MHNDDDEIHNMNNYFLLFVIILIGLCNTNCRSNQTTLTPYSELSGFERGTVLRNEITGYIDTTLVHLSGRIFTNDKEIVPTAEILIENSNFNKVIHADLNGEYRIFIEPANYKLTYRFAGLDTIQIENLKMVSGELRNIDISLGKAGTLIHYLLENKK